MKSASGAGIMLHEEGVVRKGEERRSGYGGEGDEGTIRTV